MLRKTTKTFFKALTIGLCISSGSVLSQTLPLPSNLVGFNTPEGKKLLIESKSKEDFFPLSMQFTTQNNQAYCGVASMIMVLNSLQIPAPEAP